MRKLIIIMLVMIVGLFSCTKKDTYGYTCNCTNKETKAADTSFIINVETSGEASYRCRDYADTANVYGKNIECILR